MLAAGCSEHDRTQIAWVVSRGLQAASEKVSERLCRSGVRVQRSVYPGLGHDPLVYGFLREQVEWITGRFSGETAPGSCN
jgi:hypothetical protein